MHINKIALLILLFLLFDPTAYSALKPEVLNTLKKATVFVTVTRGTEASSGTGFLVAKKGKQGLIVTNTHVVGDNPLGREIIIVFNSGTRREHSYKATVACLNFAADIALLEIKSANLPAAIKSTSKRQVTETEELFIIGFPFGAGLSTNRENPVVTISKGSVSSRRLDVNDQTYLLQIDGDINPGNSGGPIVDQQGELVGISVATVKQTNIGFAIPKVRLEENLRGLYGNLRLAKKTKSLSIFADALDPFDNIIKAKLLISTLADDNVERYRSNASGWKKLAQIQRQVDFTLVRKKTYQASFPLAGIHKKKHLIGQIALTTSSSTWYLPPFRIANRAISASLDGPNVWARKSESNIAKGEITDPGASLDLSSAKGKVLNLIHKSGLSAYIQALAKSPEIFFAESKDDEVPSKFKQRFITALTKDWTEKQIKKHYANTFLEDADSGHINTLLQIFDSPVIRKMHSDTLIYNMPSQEELLAIIKKHDESEQNTEKRNKLISEIESSRNSTLFLLAAYEITFRTILRINNDIGLKRNRRRARDIENHITSLLTEILPALHSKIRILLTKRYENIDNQELADYLEILQTDAFIWFAEREFKAYSSMVSIRFALADKKLRDLFTDVRGKSVGMTEDPSLKGLTPNQTIKSLIKTYSKAFLIKQIISKQYGKITILQNGRINDDYYGRPRKDLVTTQTILHDLKNMKLSVDDFARMLKNASIDAAMQHDIDRQDAVSRREEKARAVERKRREKEERYLLRQQRRERGWLVR